MKKNKKATSIIESMIVVMIISLGVVGMYQIYFAGHNLSMSTKYRIEAIEIAREGIEAVKNIRDTNWLLFGADYTNCWNTLNYNSLCVGGGGSKISNSSYIIYQDSNTKWKMTSKTGGSGFDSTYRNNYLVKKDNNGFYTQSGGTIDFKPIYTREIKVNNSDTLTLNYDSIVRWVDNTSSVYHEIKLNSTLKNRIK